MSDEYLETDPDTPTEHDLDEAYGGQFLGVADVGDKKIRTKIVRVRMQPIQSRDTGKTKNKAVVFFENVAKPLVLIPTNKNTLVDALGKNPANWKDAAVGVYVDKNVTYAGKKTGGVRLRVLGPAVKPKPAAQPKPTKPASEEGWPDEAGDPGFQPDDRSSDAA